MRRRAFNWSTRYVGAGLGIWVATVLLPGLRLDGPPLRGLLVILIAAAIVVVATVSVPAPAYRLVRRAMAWAQRQFIDDDGPMLWIWLLHVVNVLVGIAAWVLVASTGLWLAARTGQGLAVDGFGTAVVAALITSAVWPLARLPFGRPRPIVRELVTIGLTMAALWLAVVGVGGVHLEPGTGRLQMLTLVVLALMYHLAWLDLTVPFVTLLFRLLIAGLKLWVLSWLSDWTVVPLRIEGFWAFVLTALIVIVVTWPLRIPPAGQQTYDPYLDDAPHRHLDMHQQMSRPLY